MAGLKDITDYYRRLPDEKYGVLSKISHQHNILDVLYGGTGVQNPSPAWTYEISPGITPADQQHTGRCWIFSALAVFNHLFKVQYGINNSKACFSEAYIGFWDLFEKSRFFLQVALDSRDEDIEDNPSLAEFFKIGIQDGGDYIFAMNIMEKYGIVPTEFFPNRTYGTATTEGILSIINQILRDNAITLRKTGDRRRIKPMMHNIFAILVLSLGLPPEPWKSLNWSLEQNEGYNYYAQTMSPGELSTVNIEKELVEELEDPKLIDKPRETVTVIAPSDMGDECEGKPCKDWFSKAFASLVRPPKCSSEVQHCPTSGEEGCFGGLQRLAYKNKRRDLEKKLSFNYSPIQFYKKFVSPNKFIPLLCDPRYPYDTFIVLNDTNMLNGREGKYLNVSMDDMTEYSIASLKMNIPIFFAADVKKEMTPDGGRLHPDDDSMEQILPEMHEIPTHRERINLYNAMANHAMVISAVSLSQNNKPDWWRVVNSWGDIGVRCGMFILSHKWFERHVYSINVPTSLISRKHRNMIKEGEAKCIYLDGTEASII